MIRTRHIIVNVGRDILDWPGHRREILDKVDALEELIRSIETGRMERLKVVG